MTGTAQVTPTYGMRSVGGFGVAGWRAFCPGCGYLSAKYLNVRGCQSAVAAHRCGVARAERKRAA